MERCRYRDLDIKAWTSVLQLAHSAVDFVTGSAIICAPNGGTTSRKYHESRHPSAIRECHSDLQLWKCHSDEVDVVQGYLNRSLFAVPSFLHG